MKKTKIELIKKINSYKRLTIVLPFNFFDEILRFTCMDQKELYDALKRTNSFKIKKNKEFFIKLEDLYIAIFKWTYFGNNNYYIFLEEYKLFNFLIKESIKYIETKVEPIGIIDYILNYQDIWIELKRGLIL